MPTPRHKRDYKKEYARDHASAKQRSDRSKRTTARYRLEKEGRVKKGDGKHVHHKTALSKGGSNKRDNWQVVSAKRNLKKSNKNGKA